MEELDKIPASRRATTPMLIFFFLTVVEFIAFYLFWLFFSTYSGYYVYFVQRTLLLALLVAGSVTAYRTAKNTKEVILHSALVSIPRSIFFIPFFYLEFLSNVLYDSIDAIALSLFSTSFFTSEGSFIPPPPIIVSSWKSSTESKYPSGFS